MRARFALTFAMVVCSACATSSSDDPTFPLRKDGSTSPDDVAVADVGTLVDSSMPIDTAVVLDTSSPPDTAKAVVDTAPPIDMGPMTLDLVVDTTECKVITCPSTHPFVVGCNIKMNGDSSQGCAIHAPGTATVTFKEGQNCGSEYVKGTVTCGTADGGALSAANCIMNKSKPLYITKIGDCPT